MYNFKEIAEKCLNRELSGTFVLRKGDEVHSSLLKRYSSILYPYNLDRRVYTYNGNYLDCYTPSNYDIINFIPDMNMKENELTIEIPNDKIIDWEESKKQNKIVLKDKQLTYRDICRKLFNNEAFYYIKPDGSLGSAFVNGYTSTCGKTEHQLKCLLAKNKLANVAKYLNDGWKPGKTDLGHFDAWVLFMTPNAGYMGSTKIENCCYNSNILFKSKELAQQAIEILGEETVKLALEPLGI